MEISKFGAILPLSQTLQQGRWKLLDFGPQVEISFISVKNGSFYDVPPGAFADFISDQYVQAPKRWALMVNLRDEPEHCQGLLSTVIDVFVEATHPKKLFEHIRLSWWVEFALQSDIIKAVKDRFKDDKALQLLPKELRNPRGKIGTAEHRGFRLAHPKLGWTLEAVFEGGLKGGSITIKHSENQ